MSSYYDDASLMLLASGGAQKDGKVYSVKPVPVYGANIITPIANSDFSSDTGYWNLETNISISGGSMNMSATPNNASFYKTGIIQIGKSYRVEITISGYSEGFIDSNNGNNFSFPAANGIHTFYFVGGNAALVFSANGTTTLSVDNVSVKEVLVEDGDFTFTRGSNLSATRVDASQLIEKGRENLVLYSEQFNNGYWDKREYGSGTIPSVTADYGIAPNGTNTADRVQFPSQSGIQVSSLQTPVSFTYPLLTASVYVKTISGTCSNLVLRAGASEYNVPSFGTTWTRIETFSLSNAANEGLAIRNRPSTSGDGSAIDILVWGAQVEQGLVATPYIETGATTAQAGILENTPRFDYSGGATCPSLLLEPSRTNLEAYSEYFNAAVVKVNVVITPNATTSPEGVVNASSFLDNATSGSHYFYSPNSTTSASGTTITHSIFAKANSNSWFQITSGSNTNDQWANFDLTNGVVGNSSASANADIQPMGNGWYRCIINSTTTTTNAVVSSLILLTNDVNITTRNTSYAGNGNGVYVYGLQTEIASYPTSYIPTYGVSQTRAVDLCNKTGISSLIGQTEGTLFIEMNFTNRNQVQVFTEVGNGNTERVLIYCINNLILCYVNTNILSYTQTTNEPVKMAFAYKSGDSALYVNGVLKQATSASLSYGTLPNFYLGNNAGGGQCNTNPIKQALLFKTRLSNLDLAILTGATTYNTFAAMALALNYTVYE